MSKHRLGPHQRVLAQALHDGARMYRVVHRVPGQESDKRPSREYLEAARAAINAVAAKEEAQQCELPL